MKKLVGALALVGGMLCANFAAAQTAQTVIEGDEDVVRGAQSIGVLGPDMFGEQVSLADGATPFRALDIAYCAGPCSVSNCSGWQGPTSP